MGTDIGALQRPGRAPAMPRNLCRPAQTAWAAYFKDVVSGVTRPSDTPLVLRWARNLGHPRCNRGIRRWSAVANNSVT